MPTKLPRRRTAVAADSPAALPVRVTTIAEEMGGHAWVQWFRGKDETTIARVLEGEHSGKFALPPWKGSPEFSGLEGRIGVAQIERAEEKYVVIRATHLVAMRGCSGFGVGKEFVPHYPADSLMEARLMHAGQCNELAAEAAEKFERQEALRARVSAEREARLADSIKRAEEFGPNAVQMLRLLLQVDWHYGQFDDAGDRAHNARLVTKAIQLAGGMDRQQAQVVWEMVAPVAFDFDKWVKPKKASV